MAVTGNTTCCSKLADCCSSCWIAPRGFATTPLNRLEMLLSPTEMMAQQGSSPSWLRALLGRIMTTTASASAKASALPTSFAARVNDLCVTCLLLWVRKHLLYLVLQIAC